MSGHSKAVEFDAIIIGSGISGGWAAKELAESGLKVCLIERGKMVEHGKDYHTAFLNDWEMPYRGYPSQQDLKNYTKQARSGFAVRYAHKHWFVNDNDHPYVEEKPFDWIRGYHLGGRSIVWGRQCLRLSDLDFRANKLEGIGIDWPVRYKDIAPWYDKVERFIGVSGEYLGLEQLPDGQYLPPMPLNCVEKSFKETLKKNFPNRTLTIGRVANLTSDQSFFGRTKCTYRSRCMRGCPTGGYFSSLSSTIPAASRTGNLTILVNTIVSHIIYNDTTNLAGGVSLIDTETKNRFTLSSRLIFCCASTIGSTSILLNSISERFPNGLGNDSGQLGKNLMDHHFKVGASADVPGFERYIDKEKRPVGFHIPRFRNLSGNDGLGFLRGYGFQGYCSRLDWRRGIKEMSYGEKLKTDLLKPGQWRIGLVGFGECLPYESNQIGLNQNKHDRWGLPIVSINCQFKRNEREMRLDMKTQAVEMLKTAGYLNVKPFDLNPNPGLAIHEMGTARMGENPAESVLNRFNQVHSVKNVYVTDGSFMVSSAYQNPSLSYMAFTARAAQHAVKQLKEGRFDG